MQKPRNRELTGKPLAFCIHLFLAVVLANVACNFFDISLGPGLFQLHIPGLSFFNYHLHWQF